MYVSYAQGGVSYPPPGTVVSVPIVFGYRHRGIVSDQWHLGKPMVISGSGRAGCVLEEPWDAFADGSAATIEGYPSQLPAFDVLRRARAHIGTRYRLFDWNCDHVVAVAHGQKPESPQVAATTAAVVLALSIGFLAARAG
jgi:hypothetical protein